MTEVVNTQTGELLALPDATVTATALVFAEDMPFDEWVALGEHLSRMTQGLMWWVGDWWRYGERRYGERAAHALKSERWTFQTFMDAGWVSGRFETSRRREVLSRSHHREVAALEPTEADQLLDKAEANNWSKNDLRAAVKAHKRRKNRDAIAAPEITDADADQPIVVRQQDCLDLIDSLADGSVSLLLTDPPYNVGGDQTSLELGDEGWDRYQDDDFWNFMGDWLTAMRSKMAKQFTAFVFCDADASPRLCTTLAAADWPVLRQVIWHRPNLAKKRSGSLTFLSAYEPFWHCGNRALNLPDEWGSERFDVQTFAVPQANHVTDTAYHSTQKPLELFRRLVSLGALNGELVVDPFMGSGTTPLACKFEDRRCVAGDQSEEYVRIALGRLR